MTQHNIKIEQTRQAVRSVASSPDANDLTRTLADGLLVALDALALQRPPRAAAGDLGEADTEQQGTTLIEAVPPPPLTASIPPGTYEAPRGDAASSAAHFAAASSIYEAPRSPDGSIAPSAPTGPSDAASATASEDQPER